MPDVRSIVGQSLMLSFVGTEVTPDVLEMLTRTRANGFILFSHNIASPQQVHALVSTLQNHAAAIGLPPLLIGIDQEGGIVSRLPTPLVTVPSQMAQAATGDPQMAYTSAVLTGRQLHQHGINLNFAPVLDVNNNPANPVIGTRAFGDNPTLVTQYGLAALNGYRDAGVIASVKHFPGHGDTSVDSHLGLPTVPHPSSRLQEIELAPFVAAIEAGAPTLMTAHVVFEALDQRPATLSRRILTELLRESLGFNGVIFTDALDMKAIANMYSASEAACLAKAAGADVVIPLGDLDNQIAVADALYVAVESRRLPLDAFESTARRLDALRATYHLTHQLPAFAEPDPRLYAEALAVARRSITLVRGTDRLPLAPDTRIALIDCVVPRFSLVEEAFVGAELLRDLVTHAFPVTTGVALGPDSTDDEVTQALAVAQSSDVILFVTRNATLIEQQTRLATMLAQINVPLIHAAVRLPYDADVIEAAATLLTYGDPRVSLEALVDVLAGRAAAQGRLPITRASLLDT